PWEDIHGMLLDGECDMIPNLTVSPYRKEFFLFSMPVETLAVNFIIPSNSSIIKSMDKSLVIGVIEQSSGHTYLIEKKYPKIRVYDEMSALLFDILAGNIDGTLVATKNIFKLAKDIGAEENIKILGETVIETKRAFALRKSDGKLLNKINEAIKKFEKSPRYLHLYIKWYGEQKKHTDMQGVVFALVVTIIFTIIVMFLWRYYSIINKNEELSKNVKIRKESEEKYKMLFDTMLNGFALHQIVCDETGRPIDYIFLDVNRAFERLTGLKRENIVGKRVLEVLPKTEDYWIKEYGEIALNGGSKYFENYASELKKYYEVNVYRPKENQFAVVISDVTERKIAEEKINILNKNLEDKNKELEQILYVASHDLRSPLVNIQGFTKEIQISLDDLKALLEPYDFEKKSEVLYIIDEDVSSSMKYIKNSGDKMDRLLGGILKLSRVGRITANIKKININNFIKSVLKNFSYQLKEKNIIIEVEDLPDCMADEVLLDQVFSNLIENAIKYLKKDQKDAKIVINGKIEKNQALYSVEDNGVGIAKEHYSKIFELFYRLNPEDTPGHGLGLTIVRKILHILGGNISLSSELGGGTAFYISLPKG
nr:ATP-binding protein [Spirochaetota bacterium]